MADQLIEEQITEFKEVFALFDEDSDGKLSLIEFGSMLTAGGAPHRGGFGCDDRRR